MPSSVGLYVSGHQRMQVQTMPRTPLQQLGDIVGMYAYLAAVGGLRYWSAVRRAGIEEQTLPVETEVAPQAEAFTDTVEYEIDPDRARTPVT